MTEAKIAAMKAATAEAAADPQPGDYWHEMFSAVCLVVARRGDAVCLCRETRSVDEKHYEFVAPEWMTVAAFGRWLSYDTIAGYWADIGSRGSEVSAYAALIPPLPT